MVFFLGFRFGFIFSFGNGFFFYWVCTEFFCWSVRECWERFVLGFYRVVVWFGTGKVFLIGCTGFHRVLLGFVELFSLWKGFYWVLLGFTGFYRVITGGLLDLEFGRSFWKVVLNFTRFYWVSWNSYRFGKVFFTGFYWVLPSHYWRFVWFGIGMVFLALNLVILDFTGFLLGFIELFSIWKGFYWVLLGCYRRFVWFGIGKVFLASDSIWLGLTGFDRAVLGWESLLLAFTELSPDHYRIVFDLLTGINGFVCEIYWARLRPWAIGHRVEGRGGGIEELSIDTWLAPIIDWRGVGMQMRTIPGRNSDVRPLIRHRTAPNPRVIYRYVKRR